MFRSADFIGQIALCFRIGFGDIDVDADAGIILAGVIEEEIEVAEAASTVVPVAGIIGVGAIVAF